MQINISIIKKFIDEASQKLKQIHFSLLKKIDDVKNKKRVRYDSSVLDEDY